MGEEGEEDSEGLVDQGLVEHMCTWLYNYMINGEQHPICAGARMNMFRS